MQKLGLRGRSSVMNRATIEQWETVRRLIDRAEAEGVRRFATRYPTYIGPGSTPPGTICVETDGRIGWLVYPDGLAV